MKTKSSAKKRFKLTGTGKIKRKHAFKSHILTKKGTKQKRNLTHSTTVDKADVPNIKRLLIVPPKAARFAYCPPAGRSVCLLSPRRGRGTPVVHPSDVP